MNYMCTVTCTHKSALTSGGSGGGGGYIMGDCLYCCLGNSGGNELYKR